MAMGDPLVRLVGVSALVPTPNGDRALFEDLHLDLSPAESLAIVGPSGHGKTSLLAICGLLSRPQAGTVEFEGRPVVDREAAEIRRRSIGFVFQDYRLLRDRSALDNVSAAMAYLPLRERRRRARNALHDVGLASRTGELVARLSGGEQQRVAIARALAKQPALVLADEPTGALDAATGVEVLNLLVEGARTRGAAVVIVTHDGDVAAACGRRAQLFDGVLTQSDPSVSAHN